MLVKPSGSALPSALSSDEGPMRRSFRRTLESISWLPGSASYELKEAFVPPFCKGGPGGILH